MKLYKKLSKQNEKIIAYKVKNVTKFYEKFNDKIKNEISSFFNLLSNPIFPEHLTNIIIKETVQIDYEALKLMCEEVDIKDIPTVIYYSKFIHNGREILFNIFISYSENDEEISITFADLQFIYSDFVLDCSSSDISDILSFINKC